jgi:hypothetical protein
MLLAVAISVPLGTFGMAPHLAHAHDVGPRCNESGPLASLGVFIFVGGVTDPAATDCQGEFTSGHKHCPVFVGQNITPAAPPPAPSGHGLGLECHD